METVQIAMSNLYHSMGDFMSLMQMTGRPQSSSDFPSLFVPSPSVYYFLVP